MFKSIPLRKTLALTLIFFAIYFTKPFSSFLGELLGTIIEFFFGIAAVVFFITWIVAYLVQGKEKNKQ